MICLVLSEESLDKDLEVYKTYSESIDMLELRADFLGGLYPLELSDFLSKIKIPCIFTLRRIPDGGKSTLSEKEHKESLLMAAKQGFSYVDVEDDITDTTFLDSMRTYTRVVHSFHDFSGLPSDLLERMIDTLEKGDIPKAAVFPRETRDLSEIFETGASLFDYKNKQNSKAQWILLGMGEIGFPTRILTQKTGSLLTYTSKEGTEAAPGHVSPSVLNQIYHYRDIDQTSRIFGIIGNPLLHTRSPEIHNKGYREVGIHGVYLPFPTTSVQDFFKLAQMIKLEGFSVTIPFKTQIVPFLDGVDDSVSKIGACNTVYKREGRWLGTNTDCDGFMAPLKEAKPGKAVVLGAGGAARAVVYGLLRGGFQVTILNRTLSRGRTLAEEFGCRFHDFDLAELEDSDLIVQTTSVGMFPDVNKNPVEGYDFKPSQIAYDIIYNPEQTRFLSSAQSVGCRLIGGMEMLQHQAAAQFKLFTGEALL